MIQNDNMELEEYCYVLDEKKFFEEVKVINQEEEK